MTVSVKDDIPDYTTKSQKNSDVRKRSERRIRARETVKGVRYRLTSATGTRPDFDHELLSLFARNHITASIAMSVFSVAVAAFIGVMVNLTIGIVWGFLVLSSQATLAILARSFERKDPEIIDVKIWNQRFVAAKIYHGTAWATLVIILTVMAKEPRVDVMLFATMLMIVAIGTMLSHPIPLAAVAGSLPIATAVAIKFGVGGDMFHITLAIITMVGVLFFLFVAQNMHFTNLAMLEARADKDLLIGELEQEKAISEEARHRAEEANQAKSRFLATMSHELRTPLNAILGFSEVMIQEVFGPLPNEHYKNYSKDIHSSGSHLLNLINEILDLSRIEAGRKELNEEAMSLSHAVEESMHLLEMKAKSKSITMEANIDETLCRLWADERAIRQIIINLLSNAIKFTPQNGDIFLMVGWTEDGGQYICIRDTGPGIAAEEIPVVLSSFGQGAIALKSTEQGTGLGLPIVQALVKMHDGVFDFQSKLREGTTVTCIFPPKRVMEVMEAVDEGAKIQQASSQRSSYAA